MCGPCPPTTPATRARVPRGCVFSRGPNCSAGCIPACPLPAHHPFGGRRCDVYARPLCGWSCSPLAPGPCSWPWRPIACMGLPIRADVYDDHWHEYALPQCTELVSLVQLDDKTTGTYFTPMFKHYCHTTLHRTYYSSTYYSTDHNKNNMALHNLQVVQPLQYAISNTAQSKCQKHDIV